MLVVPDPPLGSDGIALRRPQSADVRWITEACNDPEIARFIVGMPSPYTEADARSFLDRVETTWAAGTKAAFAIVADGDGLGMIELHLSPNDPALAGVGYWLGRKARGRGAATAAVKLLARWAFEGLGISRLHLTTAPDNRASQRVAERAGFTREGLLRAWVPTAEGRRDSVMFSLLPDDLADTS